MTVPMSARMLGVPHQSEAGNGHETGKEDRRDDPALRLLRHADSMLPAEP